MDTPATVKKGCPPCSQDSPAPRKERAMQQRSQVPLGDSGGTSLAISLLRALDFVVREQRSCPSLCSVWRACL